LTKIFYLKKEKKRKVKEKKKKMVQISLIDSYLVAKNILKFLDLHI